MNSRTKLFASAERILREVFPDGLRLDDDDAVGLLRARLADAGFPALSDARVRIAAASAGVMFGGVVYPLETQEYAAASAYADSCVDSDVSADDYQTNIPLSTVPELAWTIDSPQWCADVCEKINALLAETAGRAQSLRRIAESLGNVPVTDVPWTPDLLGRFVSFAHAPYYRANYTQVHAEGASLGIGALTLNSGTFLETLTNVVRKLSLRVDKDVVLQWCAEDGWLDAPEYDWIDYLFDAPKRPAPSEPIQSVVSSSDAPTAEPSRIITRYANPPREISPELAWAKEDVQKCARICKRINQLLEETPGQTATYNAVARRLNETDSPETEWTGELVREFAAFAHQPHYQAEYRVLKSDAASRSGALTLHERSFNEALTNALARQGAALTREEALKLCVETGWLDKPQYAPATLLLLEARKRRSRLPAAAFAAVVGTHENVPSPTAGPDVTDAPLEGDAAASETPEEDVQASEPEVVETLRRLLAAEKVVVNYEIFAQRHAELLAAVNVDGAEALRALLDRYQVRYEYASGDFRSERVVEVGEAITSELGRRAAEFPAGRITPNQKTGILKRLCEVLYIPESRVKRAWKQIDPELVGILRRSRAETAYRYAVELADTIEANPKPEDQTRLTRLYDLLLNVEKTLNEKEDKKIVENIGKVEKRLLDLAALLPDPEPVPADEPAASEVVEEAPEASATSVEPESEPESASTHEATPASEESDAPTAAEPQTESAPAAETTPQEASAPAAAPAEPEFDPARAFSAFVEKIQELVDRGHTVVYYAQLLKDAALQPIFKANEIDDEGSLLSALTTAFPNFSFSDSYFEPSEVAAPREAKLASMLLRFWGAQQRVKLETLVRGFYVPKFDLERALNQYPNLFLKGKQGRYDIREDAAIQENPVEEHLRKAREAAAAEQARREEKERQNSPEARAEREAAERLNKLRDLNARIYDALSRDEFQTLSWKNVLHRFADYKPISPDALDFIIREHQERNYELPFRLLKASPDASAVVLSLKFDSFREALVAFLVSLNEISSKDDVLSWALDEGWLDNVNYPDLDDVLAEVGEKVDASEEEQEEPTAPAQESPDQTGLYLIRMAAFRSLLKQVAAERRVVYYRVFIEENRELLNSLNLGTIDALREYIDEDLGYFDAGNFFLTDADSYEPEKKLQLAALEANASNMTDARALAKRWDFPLNLPFSKLRFTKRALPTTPNPAATPVQKPVVPAPSKAKAQPLTLVPANLDAALRSDKVRESTQRQIEDILQTETSQTLPLQLLAQRLGLFPESTGYWTPSLLMRFAEQTQRPKSGYKLLRAVYTPTRFPAGVLSLRFDDFKEALVDAIKRNRESLRTIDAPSVISWCNVNGWFSEKNYSSISEVLLRAQNYFAQLDSQNRPAAAPPTPAPAPEPKRPVYTITSATPLLLEVVQKLIIDRCHSRVRQTLTADDVEKLRIALGDDSVVLQATDDALRAAVDKAGFLYNGYVYVLSRRAINQAESLLAATVREGRRLRYDAALGELRPNLPDCVYATSQIADLLKFVSDGRFDVRFADDCVVPNVEKPEEELAPRTNVSDFEKIVNAIIACWGNKRIQTSGAILMSLSRVKFNLNGRKLDKDEITLVLDSSPAFKRVSQSLSYELNPDYEGTPADVPARKSPTPARTVPTPTIRPVFPSTETPRSIVTPSGRLPGAPTTTVSPIAPAPIVTPAAPEIGKPTPAPVPTPTPVPPPAFTSPAAPPVTIPDAAESASVRELTPLQAAVRQILVDDFDSHYDLTDQVIGPMRLAFSAEAAGFEASQEELVRTVQELGFRVGDEIVLIDDQIRQFVRDTIVSAIRNGSKIVFHERFLKRRRTQLPDHLDQPTFAALLKNIFSGVDDVDVERDYLRVGGRLPQNLLVLNEIKRVWGEYASERLQDICDALPWIPVDVVRAAIESRPDLYMPRDRSTAVENIVYISLERFEIERESREKFLSLVRREIANVGYFVLGELPVPEEAYELFDSIDELAICRLAYKKLLEPNGFVLQGNIISYRGVNIDDRDVFRRQLREIDSLVSVDELFEQMKNIKEEKASKQVVLEDASAILVRVDKDHFVPADEVDFDVEGVDEALLDAFDDSDYRPVRGIVYFSEFPDAGYEWNSFLLESFVDRFSRKFKLCRTGVNDSNLGAIVRRTSRIADITDIVADFLPNSVLPLHDEKAVQQAVVDQGYLGGKSKILTEAIARAKKLRR